MKSFGDSPIYGQGRSGPTSFPHHCTRSSSRLSGRHSGQGSTISGIPQDIRSRQKISEHSDGLLAQTFDAVLAVRVILAGGSYLKMLSGGTDTHSTTPKGQRLIDKDIYLLLKEGPEIIPGSRLSYRRGS